MGTLAGKTYEVQADQGDGRWIVADVHETRNASIDQAKRLLESGKYAGTRVIAEDPRKGDETIFEEMNAGFGGKPITIVAIDKAPLCDAFDDCFRLESRRVLGRVFRNYLEHHTRSALEMMCDASQIRMLENSDTLFPQAIQQIAAAQTRGTDTKAVQRADMLYKIATKLREKASAAANDTTGYEILREKGIDALIKRVTASHGEAEARFYIMQAFARYLHDGGDWNAKIELLCKLGVDGLSNESVSCLDDVLAEILDGAPAVQELLGGQPDLASATRVIIMLTQGRVRVLPNTLSCIEHVNDLMGRLDLACSKHVLLERVTSHLGGIKKLTREDAEAERNALTVIIRELTETAGIMGGVRMCGAITQRARIAFSRGGEDLTFPDAMSRIINLLPHRAPRLGYLIELSNSPVAGDHRSLVLSELEKTIQQVTSLVALVAPGSSRANMLDSVAGLKKRLTSVDIPEALRVTLTRTFDSLLTQPEPAASTHKDAPITDEEFKAMLNEKPKHREAVKGEDLFAEGEMGEEAYLILDGEIEVFQRVGNTEHVIATLRKGEILGEMSLIDNQPRMASARVAKDAKFLVISQKSLQVRLDRLQQEDRVLRRLVDTLVSRLRGEAQAGA